MAIKPRPIKDLIESPFGRGPAALVDRFSLQPIIDYLNATQTRASLSGDPPPEMFNSGTGKLPAYTASGVDVDLLRHVAWTVRHAAAATKDTGRVYAAIEASADPDIDPQEWQTPDGAAALRAYVGRCWRWATAPAPSDRLTMTDREYDEWINAR